MTRDQRVTVLTAAMCQGNKLEPIRDEFPDRFFDCGICESHAVAFAAGQAGNRYFDESAPFKSRKTDLARCGHSLAVAVQVLRQLCVMLAPVLPFGMEKLWSWLGMESDLWRGGWDEGRRPVPAGRPLGKPEILFPRLEEEQIARGIMEAGTLKANLLLKGLFPA